jgi:ComF family protein
MLVAVRCQGCSRIFRYEGSRRCPECTALDRAPDTVIPSAAVDYAGDVRGLVGALKFGRRRRVARALAARLADDIRSDASAPHFDVVTWAPTSSRRHGARGFDQSELLARMVARRLGLPCRHLLERSRGVAQTGRSRDDRLSGPVFRARPLRRDLHVLVIDDVITTGATLRAAAHALRLAGAQEVSARAVAATPSR